MHAVLQTFSLQVNFFHCDCRKLIQNITSHLDNIFHSKYITDLLKLRTFAGLRVLIANDLYFLIPWKNKRNHSQKLTLIGTPANADDKYKFIDD